MAAEMLFPPLLRLLLTGACLVILIAGMKAAAPLLNTILLAYLLALTLSPLQDWLMRKRLSLGLAVLTTILLVIVGGSLIISLLGASLAQLIDKLPTYHARLTDLYEAVNAALADRGVQMTTLVSPELVSPRRLVEVAGTLLRGVLQALGNALLLLLIVIVFLIEFASIQSRTANAQAHYSSPLARFSEFSPDIRKYVTITGLIGLVTATACFIWLRILGVSFAISWAVLSFFLNFIPGIGDILAFIPPAVITLLEQGWEKALLVIVGMWLINFVGDKVIKPKFMQQGLDISIMLIFLSLLFWAWVLGPTGMFLAVPLTLTVRKIMVNYTDVVPSAPVQTNVTGSTETPVVGQSEERRVS
jgi:predicted PurR-regulated permease PerM